MPVLVLDGHSRAAVETLQSLGRRGVAVDVASEHGDCLAFRSRYAALRVYQPFSSAEFEAWLRALDSDRKYELIVPSTEASLLGLRAIPEHDPLRRRAVLPGNDALEIALDKQRTLDLARALEVPAPTNVFLSDITRFVEPSSFPIVLKPVRSKVVIEDQLQTLSVVIAREPAQVREQLRRWLPLTPVLLQEYVSGRGVGVEFLFDHGKSVWHFAHERVHEFPLSGGASSYRRSIQPPRRLLSDAERMLAALNWHGVAMVEFKVGEDGRHWIMEINPRLWGSLALALDAGVDFPFGLLQLARSGQVSPQPAYRERYYTRDLRTDVQWFKANLRADRNDPFRLTRPRFRSVLELLRPLLGNESWDHFDWRDPKVVQQILRQTIADQGRPLMRTFRVWRRNRQMMQHHRRVLKDLARHGDINKILFLCHGNICRSPLAAALAGKALAEVQTSSAGFHHRAKRTCPEKILEIGRDLGVDLSRHASSRLGRKAVEDADLILAMDLDDVARLEQEMPAALSQTTLLGLFAAPPTATIPDPYTAGLAETRRVCKIVQSAVEGLARVLERSRRRHESRAHSG